MKKHSAFSASVLLDGLFVNITRNFAEMVFSRSAKTLLKCADPTFDLSFHFRMFVCERKQSYAAIV